MLEQGTVGLLERARVADRRHREGLPHGGFALALDGDPFRIDLHSLTWGRGVTVYGQTEVTKDLIEALMAHDDPDEGSGLVFESEDVVLHDVVGAAPWRTGTHAGEARRVCCDFIAGCDGDHGVSRAAILAAVRTDDERVYLFGDYAFCKLGADHRPFSGLAGLSAFGAGAGAAAATRRTRSAKRSGSSSHSRSRAACLNRSD